jgi:Cu(I)/Ag(I) efflux system outer membrane protein
MAFMLAGCTSLAPDYSRPKIVLTVFAVCGHAGGDRRLAGDRLANLFVDPQAKRLIDVALRNNRDLRMAMLNVEAARAQYNVTDAGRYPQLDSASSAAIKATCRAATPRIKAMT